MRPIKWDLLLLPHETRTAHPGHVTRPPVVASRYQATCSPQKAQAAQAAQAAQGLPRGLGPHEPESRRTRKDDVK